LKNYRVLIVDTQRDRRRKLRSGLKSLEGDFEVVEVASGEEALLLLARQPFDLLVSNQRLAGISGVELLQKTRRRAEGLKSILLLGTSEAKIQQQAVKAGAAAILSMPVETADFLDAVERCLGLVESIALPVEPGSAQETCPAPSPTERLASLRQELQAECAALLDEGGQVQAQAGESLESALGPTLLAAIMATLSAGVKVSIALGAARPHGLMCFSGGLQQVCMAHVGPALSLLVVRKMEKPGAPLPDSGPAILAAAGDLLELLEQLGVPLADEPENPATMETSEEAEIPGPADPHLDVIFSEATRLPMDSNEVDAFWETAAGEQNGEGISSAGALSYEQARRLGLAPKDSE